MAQGEVVIDTRVKTTKAEKDLAKFEQELEKFNEKGKQLLEQKAELEVSKQSFEEAKQQLEKYTSYLDRAKEKQKSLKGDFSDTGSQKFQQMSDLIKMLEQDVENYKSQVKITGEEYEKMQPKLNQINEQIKENAKNQNEVKQKIEETNKKINQNRLKEVQQQLSNIRSSTDGVVRKMLKWGLALFSIRSAYNFIRSAVSTLAGTNEQIGADIEYIRWALASTLQPVIETIINLAYTLLQYINYIANAWFGVNLFAKASAENFKKTKDGVKGVNTEAKKLQKTLAGFDEMNILQENGSTGSGGGGGGIGNIMPSTDLSKMLPDVEIPGWVKWIAENGEFLASIIVGIGGAFATWKVLELLGKLKLLGDGFTGFQQTLVALGIGLIFKGIYDIVTDWGEHIETIIGDVGEVITGFGTMMVGINPTSWWSWAILGVGFLLDLVPHIFDTRSETEKLKDAQDKLNKSQQEYINASKNQLNAFKNAKQAEDDLTKAGEALGLSKEETKKKAQELYELIKGKGISAYDELSESDRNLYDAYLNELDAQERLKKSNQEVSDAKKQEIRDNLEVQKYTAITTGNYKEYGDAIVDAYKKGAITSGDAGMRMSEVLKNLDKDTKKTFEQDIPWQIKQSSNAFKNSMDTILGTSQTIFTKDIPYSINKSLSSLSNLNSLLSNTNTLFSKIGVKPITVKVNGTGNYAAVGGIVTKLATGGIVNRPGRGIPVASSQMGEAGREGILPLTDSQAMETLGQAIGKYISLNATIPIYMGNRQIAREIQKIQAEDDFAYNGG